MMDLKAARTSLDFYATSLDLHCSQYELVQKLTEAEMPDNVPGTVQVVAELKRVRRESFILRILISKALAKEASRCICGPEELVDLMDAQNRTAAAQGRANILLEQHDQKEIEKNAPPRESDVARAIREFQEKQKILDDEQRNARRNRRDFDPKRDN